MRRLVLLALLALPSAASAGGWTDFAALFPAYPCADGWMACVVDGEAVSPEPARDAQGYPMPSDLRVDFRTLQPTAVFSPFSPPSSYTGAAPATMEEVAAVETTKAPADVPRDAVVQKDVPKDFVAKDVPKDVAPKDVGQDVVAKVVPHDGTKDVPKDVVRDVPKDGAKDVAPTPADDAKKAALVTPPSDEKKAQDAQAQTMVRPVDAPVDCSNPVKLEGSAMLGKLTAGQVACLEASYAAADQQTAKDKVSRVLMANAWSAGDVAGWKKLVKRHLAEVDQSDPDLDYKYARQLQKDGDDEAAIHWAEVALDRRTAWTGDTYVQRVSALYKLRAAAAQDVWKAREAEYAKAPTDDLAKKVDVARSRTKTYAREWFEYARSAGQDTTTALTLCVSAAGTQDYCTGA